VTWLRSARTPDGNLADVEIDGGRIARVIPAAGATATGGDRDENLSGYVLFPSFAEPHAHLDKALTAGRVPNESGDLAGAIRAMGTIAGTLTRDDIRQRADQAIRTHLALGTTAVRTHVNVGGPMGLRALEALLDVKERWKRTVDLQLVALVASPLSGQPGKDLVTALKNGADIAGGCPHLDPEPERAVAICLDAAGDAGVPLDLHTDETLNPARLTLKTLAELTSKTGFPHPVTASHCCSLAVQDGKTQQEVAEKTAEAGISVIALPQTNLYLQGRDYSRATPRGLTAVRPLITATCNVAAGGDNLRDPFHPVGRGDALEVAALMVTAGHLTPDEALHTVTHAARAALKLPPVSLTPGASGFPADLVAIRAESALDALAAATQDRVVWRAGRVVARTTVHTEITEITQMTQMTEVTQITEGAAPA
jgi:cytosine deaminase